MTKPLYFPALWGQSKVGQLSSTLPSRWVGGGGGAAVTNKWCITMTSLTALEIIDTYLAGSLTDTTSSILTHNNKTIIRSSRCEV